MYIIYSRVKSNRNRTFNLKITHIFACALYRYGINNVFAQVAKKFCSARNKLEGTLLVKAPEPAVCQFVHAECSPGQGVKQLAVEGLRRGKQVCLSGSKTPPNQLDHLGMESSFPGERSS